jgi:hypothetical protein
MLAGFVDDKVEPNRYLILQRGVEGTDQDIRLGMNTYHVEIDDEASSCYGGIERFELFRDRVMIKFSQKGSVKLRGIETAEIIFRADDQKFDQLRDCLAKIFAGTTVLVEPRP